MREILFRGKRVDNGEWVYGAFCPDVLEIDAYGKTVGGKPIWLDGWIRRYCAEENHMKMYEVERSTVGQYTGLADKNGVKIFEGDIILYYGKNYIVKFIDGFAAFDLRSVDNMSSPPPITSNTILHMSIAGNIHDNPNFKS